MLSVRCRVGGVLACVAALVCLVGPGAAGTFAAPVGEPRVFDVQVHGDGPFGGLRSWRFSEPVDVVVLPSGEIVVLLLEGSPALVRVDLQGRGHVLRVPADASRGGRHSLVASADGALLFSAGGRVLRRERNGDVSTVAGSRWPRRASGDGGPAVGAGMEPTGLALLGDGSLLIADRRNHRIRRVDRSGQISTVAGTGTAGGTGDGGPATAARLAAPEHLAVYRDGSYLIVDGRRHVRVRRVDAGGRISTVAGVGPKDRVLTCGRAGFAATLLRIPIDRFSGGVAALPDGGFAFAADALGSDVFRSLGGVMRVSAAGVVRPVLCNSDAYPARADGRDLYLTGRPLSEALSAIPRPDVAAAPDGTLVLSSVAEHPVLHMIASPGASMRLGVALLPSTLAAIFDARVTIAVTETATVRVSVRRMVDSFREPTDRFRPETRS